jgi:hypothetical protein
VDAALTREGPHFQERESEIARPSPRSRASSIAALALLEIWLWSKASQTTTCVSTRISRVRPILPV